MLRSPKNSLLTAVPPTHETVFVDHYDQLFGWALKFTQRDRELAEDLLHDTYINFTLTRLDLTNIDNVEAYLYTVMRNLHLSQLRKASRMPSQTISVVDFDTADMGLWASDPRDRLRLRDELGAVCQFACIRKETSKAGSVLILRFFHGYYPEEIAKVLRTTRAVIHERMRRTRAEVRAYLDDPQKVTFLDPSRSKPAQTKLSDLDVDPMLEMRRLIFESCRGVHAEQAELNKSYATEKGEAPDRVVLAHIVSCAGCLDRVNELLDLPPLEMRYLTDTLGNDPGPDDRFGGSGNGGGGTGGGSNVLDTYRLHREAHYYHEPEELRIAVNGQLQGFQKVVAGKAEQTLLLDTSESLGFVEVFSSAGLRLLMLNVNPPPVGDGTQSLRVNLSSGRTLDADLNFSGPKPALQVRYSDPELMDAAALEFSSTPNFQAVTEADIFSTVAKPGLVGRLGDIFKSLLQPARLTSAFAALLIAALLIYQFAPTTVSAAELLNRSAEQEIAQLAIKERVLHRTLDLEEYQNGQLTTRKKIDVWHSAELGVTARRLYDEKGALVTGDWRNAGGIQTIYQKGALAKLQPLPEKRGADIVFDDFWQLSLSAKEFNSLVRKADEISYEDRSTDYLISYEPKADPDALEMKAFPERSIVKASITLSKEDLHAIEQSFTLSIDGETREYRMTEAAYEWRPANAVAPAVFEPNVELTGNAPGSPPSKGGVDDASSDGVVVSGNTNTNTANTNTATPANLATAALEVEVIDLLNGAGAFMGEQIDVSRTSDGKITVNALVETDKRKAELTNALVSVKSNPAVRIRIETVAEVQAREAKRKRAGQAQNVTVDRYEATENTSPVYEDLRKKFTESEARSYADRILRRSSQARRHALAAKQLSDRFSQTDLASLTPAERAKWIGLVTGHANKFLAEYGTLQRELTGVFPDLGGAGSGRSVATDKEIQAAVRELYNLSVACDEDLRGSFALLTGGGGSAQVKTAKFWRTLNIATAIARSIQGAN